MRAVFVNYCHPDTPHICGIRVPSFAKAMAQRGHQIVLITKSLTEKEHGIEPSELPAAMARHDWRLPLHLPVTPVPDFWLARIREDKLATPLRKAVVAHYYWRRCGVFADWVEATRPYWQVLAISFKPQVTWGTFGNTDTWVVTRQIAKLASCPWVGDLKDGWEDFIPFGLRGHTSRRFRDASAFTANSEHFAAQARPWFRKNAEVVYSGVADCFFREAPIAARDGRAFRITLTGSLYDEGVLVQFLSLVGRWARARKGQVGRLVEVIYAGADAERFRRHAQLLANDCRVAIKNYLSLEELAVLCRSASINAYLHNPKTFHHKLFELLACARPVLAFPGESEEAIRLAKAISAPLLAPRSPEELEGELDRAVNGESRVIADNERLWQQLSWQAQSANLERCLAQAQVRA
jgi:hypothetical protein